MVAVCEHVLEYSSTRNICVYGWVPEYSGYHGTRVEATRVLRVPYGTDVKEVEKKKGK